MPSPVPPLKPSAPSVSLLRFLRSQSGADHFFSAKPSSCPHTFRGRSICHNRQSYVSPLVRASKSPVARPASQEARITAHGFKVNGSNARPQISGLSGASRNSSLVVMLKQTRNASTRSRPLLRRLLDMKRSKAAAGKAGNNKQQAPNGGGNNGPFLDEGTANLFNLNRSLAGKATNEPRLRCTEFDNNGNVTLVNGEFKKSELIAKVRSFLLHWHKRLVTLYRR